MTKGARYGAARNPGGAFFTRRRSIMNTIVTKDGLTVDEAVFLHECAYRCALAYVTACASAVLDYVERTTGRRDYELQRRGVAGRGARAFTRQIHFRTRAQDSC